MKTCDHCGKTCAKRVPVMMGGSVAMVGTGCAKKFSPAKRSDLSADLAEGGGRWLLIWRKWGDEDRYPGGRLPPFAPPAQVPGRALAFAWRIISDETERIAEKTSKKLTQIEPASESPHSLLQKRLIIKNDIESRGGWDSQGVWGHNADSIQSAWFAARYKIGRRFEILLRWSMGNKYYRKHNKYIDKRYRALSFDKMLTAMKSISEYAGGSGALASGGRWPSVRVFISPKVRAILGKLSTPAQIIAMEGSLERAREEKEHAGDPQLEVYGTQVRTRHLNLENAIKIDKMYNMADMAVKEKIMAAASVISTGGVPSWWSPDTPLVPQYPLLHSKERGEWGEAAQIAARLALGKRPVDVVKGLSSKEAHSWLEAGVPQVERWIVERSPGGVHLPSRAHIRSIPVARWVSAVLADPKRRDAILRDREIQGPHGEVIVVQYINHIDEVMDEDLENGTKSSVTNVMEKAARRITEEKLKALKVNNEVLAPPPEWWKQMKFARLLDSPGKLVAEGEEMSHCVGAYSDYLRRRKSVCIAINVNGLRSTAEFDYDTGAVLQHMGKANQAPSKECERVVDIISRRTEMLKKRGLLSKQ